MFDLIFSTVTVSNAQLLAVYTLLSLVFYVIGRKRENNIMRESQAPQLKQKIEEIAASSTRMALFRIHWAHALLGLSEEESKSIIETAGKTTERSLADENEVIALFRDNERKRNEVRTEAASVPSDGDNGVVSGSNDLQGAE